MTEPANKPAIDTTAMYADLMGAPSATGQYVPEGGFDFSPQAVSSYVYTPPTPATLQVQPSYELVGPPQLVGPPEPVGLASGVERRTRSRGAGPLLGVPGGGFDAVGGFSSRVRLAGIEFGYGGLSPQAIEYARYMDSQGVAPPDRYREFFNNPKVDLGLISANSTVSPAPSIVEEVTEAPKLATPLPTATQDTPSAEPIPAPTPAPTTAPVTAPETKPEAEAPYDIIPGLSGARTLSEITETLYEGLRSANSSQFSAREPDSRFLEIQSKPASERTAEERSYFSSMFREQQTNQQELLSLEERLDRVAGATSQDVFMRAQADPQFAKKYFSVEEDKEGNQTLRLDSDRVADMFVELYPIEEIPTGASPSVQAAYRTHNSMLLEAQRGLKRNPDANTIFNIQTAQQNFTKILDGVLGNLEEVSAIGGTDGNVPAAVWGLNPGLVKTNVESAIAAVKRNGAAEDSTVLRNLEKSLSRIESFERASEESKALILSAEAEYPIPNDISPELLPRYTLAREVAFDEYQQGLEALDLSSSDSLGMSEEVKAARRQRLDNALESKMNSLDASLELENKKTFFATFNGRNERMHYNWDNIMSATALLLTLYQGTIGRELERKQQLEDMMALERFRTDESLRLYAGRLGARGGGGGGGSTGTAGSSSISAIASSGGFG